MLRQADWVMVCCVGACLVSGLSEVAAVRVISREQQTQIVGGDRCNGDEAHLWCGAVTQTCNGKDLCKDVADGQPCKNTDVVANTGSIYLCQKASAAQTNCVTGTTNQTCTVKTECQCATTVGIKSCDKKDRVNDTRTKFSVTATTDCTTS